MNGECKLSSEMVENSIEAVSKEVDIEMFVKTSFTGALIVSFVRVDAIVGSARPPQLKYEPYKNTQAIHPN